MFINGPFMLWNVFCVGPYTLFYLSITHIDVARHATNVVALNVATARLTEYKCKKT